MKAILGARLRLETLFGNKLLAGSVGRVFGASKGLLGQITAVSTIVQAARVDYFVWSVLCDTYSTAVEDTSMT